MINGAFVFGMLRGRNAALHTGPCIHPTLPVNNPRKTATCWLLFLVFCLSLLLVEAVKGNIQMIAYSRGACYFFLKKKTNVTEPQVDDPAVGFVLYVQTMSCHTKGSFLFYFVD